MLKHKIHFKCAVVIHSVNGYAAIIDIEGSGTIDDNNKEKILTLSEETAISLISLGQVLKKVRARLASEGYNIDKIEKYEQQS